MIARTLHLWRLAALVGALALAFSCGRDRVADGGTSGAEAENAVTARIVGWDGKPVAGAKVLARPSGSLSDSVWDAAVTDSVGIAVLRLSPSLDWSLDVSSDTFAAQISVRSGEEPSVVHSVSLARRARLEGRLVGLRAGSQLRLAGLGRSATLDSNLRFSFSDLPGGAVDLRCANASWMLRMVPGETLRVSLDTANGGSIAGDPAKSLVYVRNLLPSTGPDALVAMEFPVPSALAGAVSRLKLTASGSQGQQTLPVQVVGWDSLSRRVRLWTRTPVGFEGPSLALVLDTIGPAETRSNPFVGRGMATTVFFSQVPTKNGTLDSWPNLSQPGRDMAATPIVSWQADPGDPFGGGIVASDQSQMLVLGATSITSDLSMVSVRIRLLSGWQGWARILQVSDSAGMPLVQLVRSADSLMVIDGAGASAKVVAKPDTLWHTYTWSRTASSWRMRFDSQHLLEKADPSLKPGGLTLAEGGRMRMSQLMLWADTTVQEPVPAGGQPVATLVPPVR